MDLQDLISRLALALGIGLLIGLERGWRRREASPGSRAAGIRIWRAAGCDRVGVADVDAITVSMARLVPQTLEPAHAALAILAAVTSDTVSKIGIGAAVGRGRFAAKLAVMASGCLLLGGAWLTLIYAV